MLPIAEVIRTKRKSIALIVQRDGRLVVRAPLAASDDDIYTLVNKKSDWILSKQKLIRETYPTYKPKEYVNGEGFWHLGKIYRLEIVDGAQEPLWLDDCFYLARTVLPQAAKVFEQWYRSQARQVLTERVSWYSEKHGYPQPVIRITNARKRWGSCSDNGVLSFAWRLVMAPMPVIDYLVVHELVHLVEKNHSKEFWSKMKLAMPDYQKRIDWLEVNGNLLTLD
ncbi:MAG: SprT family zinc-dependent metalloprotease [Chloroflexota bacterium]